MTDLSMLDIAVRFERVVDAGEALDDFEKKSVKAEKATDRLAKETEKLARSSGLLKTALVGLAGPMAALFTGAGFASGISSAIKRMDEYESKSRKIDKALIQNGYTFDLTTKKIQDFARNLEKLTGTNEMQVLDLAPNLASFGFTEDVALRSIELANDMAAAWGGDLRQNFEGLGRALSDPVKGMAMLSARGITLDDTQKKLVKSLVDSGNGLKAQQVIFEALEAQVKGVAEAGYTPFQKATDLARKSVEFFFEKLASGEGISNSIINVLSGVTSAFNFLGENIGTVTSAFLLFSGAHIASGMSALVVSVLGLGSGLSVAAIAAKALSVALAFAGGPVGLAVMALGAAYLYLSESADTSKKSLEKTNSAIGDNEKALHLSISASAEFRKSLRDNILVQKEAAMAAYTEAIAQARAAKARDRSWGLGAITNGLMITEGYKTAQARADEMEASLTTLEDQLARVDKIINTPAGKPEDRQFGGPDDDKAEKSAAKLKKAYDDLLRSAKDRTEQMELEEKLVGKNVIQAEVLRIKLEALQEAQKKGLSLSPDQLKALDEQAEKYGKVAERVAALNLMLDAQFEREQMFRSPIDQRVFSDLKSAGIEIDSVAGQAYAAQVKLNEQLSLSRDLTKDFASGFISDMLSGKSAMDSLINSLKKLGDKLLDMALDEAINGLFKSLLGVTGGGGGGLLGGLFGGGAGFFPSAPSMGGGIGLFANGGISNKPAIFGEAGAEAAVPLPDGRTIPVTLSGNAGGGSYTDNRSYSFQGTQQELIEMKAYVAELDQNLDARAVGAIREAEQSNYQFGS